MIQAMISDFSFTLLFPKDTHLQSTNTFHAESKNKPGYKVFDYFDFNFELLEMYKRFPGEKYIFTTKYIQEEPEIKELTEPVFQKTFIARDLGLKKDDSNSYILLSEKIGIAPEKIFFIDDSERNLEAAQEAGMQVFLYNKAENTKLEKYLNNN